MGDVKLERMERMFIDTPWEVVQRQIEWVAESELLDEGYPPVKPTKAEEEWAQKTAKKIAQSVMQSLDGGEYPADKDGLRCSATENTDG